jgi:hypothetical protein
MSEGIIYTNAKITIFYITKMSGTYHIMAWGTCSNHFRGHVLDCTTERVCSMLLDMKTKLQRVWNTEIDSYYVLTKLLTFASKNQGFSISNNKTPPPLRIAPRQFHPLPTLTTHPQEHNSSVFLMATFRQASHQNSAFSSLHSLTVAPSFISKS